MMVDRRDNREDIARLEVLTARILVDNDKERDVVQQLEKDMKENFDKVDDRLRVIERNMYIAMGALALLQFGLKFLH